MSFHRENIIWQSKNGTWNRGFFTVAWVDYDGDPEWDVEYDFDSFEWVSTGHPSEEAAHRSWNGANPGGYDYRPYEAETAKGCDRYDEMAAKAPKPTRSYSWGLL